MLNTRMERLLIKNISKSYGGTHALKKACMDIQAGEVHALCGENGAGKSTLIKILSGVEIPDEGQILWNEDALPLGNVHAIESKGIVAVHQEPVVFHHLDVVDNLFVGREHSLGFGTWLNRYAMQMEAKEILETLEEDLPLTKPVGSMSLAQRQMVSIARALLNQCRILILDEPTASLTARETESLFKTILALRDQGVGILYVSHRLEEIFKLADRVSVLRDGVLLATQATKDLTQDALIQQMVGRSIDSTPAIRLSDKIASEASPVLEVRRLSRGCEFQNISFKIQAGEILGMSGLVGAGRSAVAQTVFGINGFDSGEIFFEGKKLEKHNVQKAIQRGIAMVPEDRQDQGLALPLSVETNLLLPSLTEFQGRFRLDHSAMRITSEHLISKLGIKTEKPTSAANSLSGGNQQKIVIGKWIHRNPKLFILDEPTRGVDVGAKSEVHRLVRELASQGSAVLLISSELPEILSLSHRIIVMTEGCISGELKRADANQEKLLKLALPKESKVSA